MSRAVCRWVVLAGVLLGLGMVEVTLARDAAVEPAALPREGDLTLAEPAGSVLVAVTLRPGASGHNEVWLHLEPSAADPPAGELAVRLAADGQPVPLSRCGGPCRRGQLEADGGERLQVRVTGEGVRTAWLRLPDLPAPEGDELLERATARMNALSSYRVGELLGPADPPVRSSYWIDAPDRLRVVTEPGRELVRIDDRIYSRGAQDRYWSSRSASPLRLPNHIWDEDAEPVAVRIVDAGRLDGTVVQQVAFFLQVGERPIWYRLWVDDDHLVRAAEMLASGHFMEHRYHAFDEPVTVAAPYGAAGRTAVALFGDPPRAYWLAGATVARWLAYAGVLAAAGAGGFLALLHDRREPEQGRLGRVVVVAAVAAALATFVETSLQAAAEGGGLTGLGDVEAWGQALGGATLAAVALRLAGLVGLLFAVAQLWQPRAVRGVVVAALVGLASLLPAGHSIAADRWWLALPADYAHLVAAAGWFGGLVMLTLVLRTRRAGGEPPPVRVVARFSRAALVGVGVVVAAGAVLAWVHTGSLAAIVESSYGRTVAVKVTVVAAVVAVAAYNRLRLLPALRGGNEHAAARLQRTTAAEVVGIVLVLAVTAVLVGVRPPA